MATGCGRGRQVPHWTASSTTRASARSRLADRLTCRRYGPKRAWSSHTPRPQNRQLPRAALAQKKQSTAHPITGGVEVDVDGRGSVDGEVDVDGDVDVEGRVDVEGDGGGTDGRVLGRIVVGGTVVGRVVGGTVVGSGSSGVTGRTGSVVGSGAVVSSVGGAEPSDGVTSVGSKSVGSSLGDSLGSSVGDSVGSSVGAPVGDGVYRLGVTGGVVTSLVAFRTSPMIAPPTTATATIERIAISGAFDFFRGC